MWSESKSLSFYDNYTMHLFKEIKCLHNSQNISVYCVFLLHLQTHLLLLSNRLCDGFNVFQWQSSASQKCHLSSISISSVNRKLFNTFIWVLNLTSPGFHYVTRCFRGRKAFLVCSLTGEKLCSCFLRFYFLLGIYLSYTPSVLKWRWLCISKAKTILSIKSLLSFSGFPFLYRVCVHFIDLNLRIFQMTSIFCDLNSLGEWKRKEKGLNEIMVNNRMGKGGKALWFS